MEKYLFLHFAETCEEEGGAVGGHEMNCEKSTTIGDQPGSHGEAVNIPNNEKGGDKERDFSTHESGWLGNELSVTNRNAELRFCTEYGTEDSNAHSSDGIWT